MIIHNVAHFEVLKGSTDSCSAGNRGVGCGETKSLKEMEKKHIAIKEVFVSDVTQICLILRSICSGFPLCAKKFALKQTQAPLSMTHLQWDDGYETHRQEYSLFS